MRQNEVNRQSRFSIRKLSTGICSLAIGHLIWLAPSMTVQAETINNEQPTTEAAVTTETSAVGEEERSTIEYENIAIGKEVTSSGIEPGTPFNAELAFDNLPGTRYSSAYMKQGSDANQQQTPQWLQVDLGAQAELKEIKVDFFKKVYATDYTVESSATGQGDWQTVASRQLQASSTTMDPVDTISFDTPVTSERYLRFNFKHLNHFAAGNGVSIKDIKVNGRLLAPIKKAVNPVEKLTQASLAVENDKVILTGIEADDEYTYEVIGSDNEYVVDKQGVISTYRLNDQDITLLVSARRKSDQSLVVESKQNKVVRIAAKHQETVQGTNVKPSAAIDIQEFLAGNGTVSLKATDKVYIDPTYAKQVDLFNEDLKRISGFSLASGSETESKVVFKLTNEYNLKDEGYLMRVNDDKVEVFAHNPKAFNYAAVTIAQLIQKDGALAQGVYRDYPNYAIRGMVLDVARIPMRTDFLENVSKLFRWYKLNEMHLHFNDNQWPEGNNRGDVSKWEVTEAAHRLESAAFPSLNKLPFKHDRYEGEYDFYRNVYGNPAYSLEEFKKFQKDTNDAGVNILAEFDNPGHSAAYSLYALKNPDNKDYLGKPIHHPSDLEALAINEQALPEETARAKRFIRELVSSYLDNNVLSYDSIHLGVDEYWQKNGNREAFRQYLNDLAKLAKEKGKTLRTWGALGQFSGSTPVSKDIVFDEWAQYESVTEDRIKEGYKVVNVPQPFTYVTPGRHHKDIINEQFVFENWHPTIFNLNYGGRKHAALKGEPLLLGAKGALWGDEHREGVEESDLYSRLEKSLSMIGFKTWNSNSNRNYLDYESTMEATRLKDSYRSLKTASEVLVHVDANHVSDSGLVDLSTNGHQVTAKGNVEVVDLNDEKWFKFDGNSSLETDIETIGLPYTLEMTIRPTDTTTGSLLFSRDGAIYLNKKGLKQDGTVAEGFMFNRYFYGQHISSPLEANRDYKVLNVYLDGKKIATFAQNNQESTNIKGDFRTSFMLPFKEIGKGFKGYIKDIKVYNRTAGDDEVGKSELVRKNIALHKPVYDYRHNSLWWDQGIRPFNRFKVTDGDTVAGDGRWNSSNQDRDYFIVDLEKPMNFNGLEVVFDSERVADGFKVSVSNDLKQFTEIYTKENNTTPIVNASVTPTSARYVKFEGVKRQTGKNEMAVREFRLFSPLNSKESLREVFAAKAVDVKNPTWVAVYNTLNNKFADDAQVQDALVKVTTLADKEQPVDTSKAEIAVVNAEKAKLIIDQSLQALKAQKVLVTPQIASVFEKANKELMNAKELALVEVQKLPESAQIPFVTRLNVIVPVEVPTVTDANANNVPDAEEVAENTPETGETTAPEKAPETGETTAPEKAPETGETTTPEKAPETGETTTPEKAPETGETTAPEKAPEIGETTTPEKAPETGETIAPEKAPETGETITPEKAPETGETTAPEKAPETGETTAPEKAPETGETTTTPEKAPETSDKKEHTVLAENLTQPELPIYDLQADNDGDGYKNFTELVLESNPEDKESVPQPKVSNESLAGVHTDKPMSANKATDTNDEKLSEKTTTSAGTPTSEIATQEAVTATLPETGESNYSMVFGAAAMSILASVGLLVVTRKEEQ